MTGEISTLQLELMVTGKCISLHTHLIFDRTVVELCKRDERAGGGPRRLRLVTLFIALQLSGATGQSTVLKQR